MELDSTAFYEYRLKCLDRKSVECRGTVQEYGVIPDDLFEDIPDFRNSCVYLSSCCLDIELVVDLNELLDYEGLEELLKRPCLPLSMSESDLSCLLLVADVEPFTGVP